MPSRLSPRAPTSWIALLLALAGCTTPALPSDASVDAAESGPPPDALAASDGADARPPSEGGTCANFQAAWRWNASCTDPNIAFTGASCIAQSGCSVTEQSPGGVHRGDVAGDTLTIPFSLFSTLSSETTSGSCSMVLSGERAIAHCVNADASITCDAIGTRQTFAGATSYCCDPAGSACGAGQRCQAFSVSPLEPRFTACIPAGTVAENQPCTREGGLLGADNCAAGLTCVNFGQPSPSQRACRRLCNYGNNCHSGEICFQYGPTPEVGVCLPTCNLFSAECGAGLTCRGSATWVGTGPNQHQVGLDTSCSFVGPLSPGAQCTDTLQCPADYVCMPDTSSLKSISHCLLNCDTTHACPAGQHCSVPFIPAANRTGVGACYPD